MHLSGAIEEAQESELRGGRHFGLLLALIDVDNITTWRAEFDKWGYILGEDKPVNLQQSIRFPMQKLDKKMGIIVTVINTHLREDISLRI